MIHRDFLCCKENLSRSYLFLLTASLNAAVNDFTNRKFSGAGFFTAENRRARRVAQRKAFQNNRNPKFSVSEFIMIKVPSLLQAAGSS